MKIRFVNNHKNLSAKGFELNKSYEAVKVDSPEHKGRYYVRFPELNVSIWDSEFVGSFVADTSNQPVAAKQQQAVQGKQEQAQQPAQVQSQTSDVAKVINLVAEHFNKSFMDFAEKMNQLVKESAKASDVEEQKSQSSGSAMKDIFFASLETLEFDNVTIRIVKVDNKPNVVIVVDGTPPLSLSVKSFSGEEFAQQIAMTFSETSLIRKSITSYKQIIQEKAEELKKEAEKKPKSTASANEKEKVSSSDKKEEKKAEKPEGKKEKPKSEKPVSGSEQLEIGPDKEAPSGDAPEGSAPEGDIPEMDSAFNGPIDAPLSPQIEAEKGFPQPNLGEAFADFGFNQESI